MRMLVTIDSNDRSSADLSPSDSRWIGTPPSGSQMSTAPLAVGGCTTGQAPCSERRPLCLDQFNWDSERQGSLEFLEQENARLKELVVRLSETIIKRVIDRK
jgi:hypothetical protein